MSHAMRDKPGYATTGTFKAAGEDYVAVLQARIARAEKVIEAARALIEQGWTLPELAIALAEYDEGER